MIETTRLRLLPLSINQLETLMLQPTHLEKEIGIPMARDITAGRVERAIKMKLEKMRCAPSGHHNWLTYWLVVIRSISLGAGLIGFKGIPNEHGQVEIGYGIDPAYRSQGYTTEAARSLIDWAFRTPACQTIIAPNTLKSNPASNRVLEKLGMRIYQETSTAYCWKLDRSGYLTRKGA